MSNDVIQGPGEYRMRSGQTWICLAIVGKHAVGYWIGSSGGDIPIVGSRNIETGRTLEYCDDCGDILQPSPVIDGPGTYSSQGVRTMKGDEMAFPSANDCVEGGLTKREYIAAKVLQGIAANHEGHVSDVARYAVRLADALIEELSK